jgi:hypothetical protein
MPYVIGIVLTIAVAVFARWVGFDRDRAFYPTVVVVVASYYVLFAATGDSAQTNTARVAGRSRDSRMTLIPLTC